MKNKLHRISRKLHYWGAIICALPIIVVLCSGVLLQVKKQSAWIQPPTIKGSTSVPTMSMEQIFSTVRLVPEIAVSSWDDIDRIDLRPAKGVVKVRGRNQWEVQLDHNNGKVLLVAYRRTDLIESLHDGSFFHSQAKLGVFLPAAVVLTVLWLTGMYLFAITLLSRRRSRLRKQAKQLRQSKALP